MQEIFGSSGDKVWQMDSAECIGDILVQSMHWERIFKQTSRHIWFACEFLEHGLICKVQAMAFHMFGEHSEIPFKGRVRPGAEIVKSLNILCKLRSKLILT